MNFRNRIEVNGQGVALKQHRGPFRLPHVIRCPRFGRKPTLTTEQPPKQLGKNETGPLSSSPFFSFSCLSSSSDDLAKQTLPASFRPPSRRATQCCLPEKALTGDFRKNRYTVDQKLSISVPFRSNSRLTEFTQSPSRRLLGTQVETLAVADGQQDVKQQNRSTNRVPLPSIAVMPRKQLPRWSSWYNPKEPWNTLNDTDDEGDEKEDEDKDSVRFLSPRRASSVDVAQLQQMQKMSSWYNPQVPWDASSECDNNDDKDIRNISNISHDKPKEKRTPQGSKSADANLFAIQPERSDSPLVERAYYVARNLTASCGQIDSILSPLTEGESSQSSWADISESNVDEDWDTCLQKLSTSHHSARSSRRADMVKANDSARSSLLSAGSGSGTYASDDSFEGNDDDLLNSR